MYTVTSGQSVTLESVEDGTSDDRAGSADGFVEIASASSVESIDLTVDSVGTKTEDLDVDVLGDGVETLNITSQGDSTNYLGLFDADDAITTLNVSADATFNADDDIVSTSLETVTVTGSGGADVVVGNVTTDIDQTITGGDGDDRFDFIGQLTESDTLDGGAGTDTIQVTTAAMTAGTNASVEGANAASNFEVMATSSTSATSIDLSLFTGIDQFEVGSGGPFSLGEGSSATNAVTITGADSENTLIIVDNLAGMEATADDQDGGDGLRITPEKAGGANEFSISIAAGTDASISGGDTNETGGTTDNAGDGLVASSIETLNIATDSVDDDLTIRGGVSGGTDSGNSSAPDTPGSDTIIGANGTINLSGEGDVDLGTVVAPSTDADDLTIDASDMSGDLTVATTAGNDTIIGGDGDDTITTGGGQNTYTGGGGTDTFKTASIGDPDAVGEISQITDFTAGRGGDVLNYTGESGVFEALSSTELQSVAAAADLTTAGDLAVDFQTADHTWAAFEFDSKAYALFNDTGGSDFTDSEDVIIEITGTSIEDLTADNFA